MKLRASLYFSIAFFSTLVVAGFQNCAQEGGRLELPVTTEGTSCSVRIYGSDGFDRNNFEVGEVINFDIVSNSSGKFAEASLMFEGTSNTLSQTFTTPASYQRIARYSSEIGDYVFRIEVKDGAKTVCSKNSSYSVGDSGSNQQVNCVFNAPSGNSFVAGSAVPYTITSSIPNLNAYLGGDGIVIRKQVSGKTNILNGQEIFSTAGIYHRYAEVTESLDGSGPFISCNNEIDFVISPAPLPSASPSPLPSASPSPLPSASPSPLPSASPSPLPSASASPLPSPSAGPIVPMSNLTSTPTSCHYYASTTSICRVIKFDWQSANTPFIKLYYENFSSSGAASGVNTYSTVCAPVGIGTTSVNVTTNTTISTIRRRYKVFSVSSCDDVPNLTLPLATKDVGWYYHAAIESCGSNGKLCP